MTEEKLKELLAIGEKALADAEKNANKPISKEEEQYRKEFQERCDAEAWGFRYGSKWHNIDINNEQANNDETKKEKATK